MKFVNNYKLNIWIKKCKDFTEINEIEVINNTIKGCELCINYEKKYFF